MAISTPGDTAATSPTATCLNCDAVLAGPYCSECGQRAGAPHPTVRQLVCDAAEELLQLDGKFAQSLRLLVTQPGALTSAYVAGRRVQFVSPVKLYLLCSALFFFLNAVTPAAPPSGRASGKAKAGLIETMSDAIIAEPPVAAAGASDLRRRVIARQQRSFARSRADPRGFRESAAAVVPRAMFLLLPFTALLLGIAFRRRGMNYPQHLVFMLHAQGFVFLVVTAYLARAFVPWPWLARLLSLGALAWTFAYLVLAARRVYGRGLPSTILRTMLFATAYLFLWITVLTFSIMITGMTY